MDLPAGRAPTVALLAVLTTVGLAVLLLLLPDLSWLDRTLVTTLIALVTSTMGAGCAGWRAIRSTGRRRRAWSAMSAALVSWVVGQTIWTYLQATGQEQLSFLAGVAYLGFGPLVCLALVHLRVHGGRVHRLQGVLDGLAVSWALSLLSWQTALGAAIRSVQQESALAAVVSVAPPVMDVVVIVLTVLTLARTPLHAARPPLVLLAVGLVSVSVADSAFVYLSATGGYEQGNPIDIAWSVGSGCIAMAALLDHHDGVGPQETTRDAIVSGGGLLPYIPVAIVLAFVFANELTGRNAGPFEDAAVFGLILLLLVRQYLTLRQNARLAARVAAREEELHHLAFHDALTGLANRALFRNRLEHALDLHARDRRPVALLFLDLNDFKVVNDTLGHAAGDHLLVRIAERMRGAARAGDTVARMGGDEFAVLLESGDDPQRSAQRITAVLRDPFFIAGRTIQARASIGVVELTPHDPTVPPDELLVRADAAMYVAKRALKANGHRPVATGLS